MNLEDEDRKYSKDVIASVRRTIESGGKGKHGAYFPFCPTPYIQDEIKELGGELSNLEGGGYKLTFKL